MRAVTFSLGSTLRQQIPTVRGGQKARSFMELQLLKGQKGVGIPAKHRVEKGTGGWEEGSPEGLGRKSKKDN